MRFGVLGPLAVWTAADVPVRIPEPKVRALLAVLLVQEGRPMPPARIIAELWGDQPPGNPANTLHTKVSQLRRLLAKAEPDTRPLLVRESAGYALTLAPDALDLTRFRALVATAGRTADPADRAGLLGQALALWRGAALADLAGEEFAEAAIARWEEERLVAIEDRARARLLLGEQAALAAELAELAAAHPLRERLQAAYLGALHQAGRQGEAFAGYERLRAELAEQLGVDPGPELLDLHRTMLRPPAPAAPARGNLPAPLTGLLGRAEAVRAVGAQLGESRLVTLTGAGGVGKTRLALAVAEQVKATFADGVWLVELAGLGRGQTAAGIAEAVAAALDLRAGPGSAQGAGWVVTALRDKEILLVLDNCEHVVEAVSAWTAELLAAAPRVRVLATGQEALGRTGETVWPVPPLAAGDAVRLFVARAADRQPGFTLSADNTEVVAEICRRLDGLPLALELAATRVRLLGVGEVRARLDDRFRLLAQGERAAPQRQRTLRAVVDWSWELLTPAEQVVLRRLAVHADGCTLAAAEAVCAGGPVAPDEVLELLGRLVDRSLVEVSDVDGPRYRLLESVGAYCLERLAEAGELAEVRAAHRDYYLALAERAELRGPAQRDWLRRLDLDSANLRRALEGAVAEGNGVAALQVARALLWYWFLRARLSEARRHLAAALSLVDEPEPSILACAEGFALLDGDRPVPGPVPADPFGAWFLGYCRYVTGDFAGSTAPLSAALAAFEQRGDHWGHAVAAGTRAAVGLLLGDLDQARRDARLGAELAARTGDGWARSLAAGPRAELAEIAGDYALARRCHADGLAWAEDLGLWLEAGERLGGLGRIALLCGEHEAARSHHERARELARTHGFESGRIHAEIGLALGARRRGALTEAERWLRGLLDWHLRAGQDHGTALVLAELGFVAELRGDAATALARHRSGLVAATASGDPRAVALAMEGLAGARAAGGEFVAAARSLGMAAAIRESVGAPLPPAEREDVDRISGLVAGALGEADFAAELACGRETPLGQEDAVMAPAGG
ncbi:BTAD domain-containing putative transcriptional regulator [Crossiella cryophila]|uniref:Putative ATPase n=1 Tax=Crossiella cryophila TaxID=43355 RepID=A0A7W7CHU3_9PSEU|nr:BTAD domain-containing putative transcriptional regulator [Crossiella cryophila]MBB4679744.1 putative ATPase [Crossiella cryophila]